MNAVIKPGSIVKKVTILKDNQEGYVELECSLTFDNGEVVEYIIDKYWDIKLDKYIECPLVDDKYPRGIYEYKNDEYIIIEDWDN